jgi:phospholipid-binding lipoprotein MlaA
MVAQTSVLGIPRHCPAAGALRGQQFFPQPDGTHTVCQLPPAGQRQAAAAEFASFTLNTIWGVLGFMDITKGYPELNPDPEDLGQTLGRYNIGNGFYIVWPFWGTSTLRDSVGRLGDAFLDPVSGYYLEPASTWIAIRGYNTVNELSFRIEDIDAAKKAAFDPYEAARDFYIQSRQTRIKK